MSYKDEYEVARLYTNGDFEKRVVETFEGDFKLNYHLAPPLIGLGKKPNGRPRKRAFGQWTMSAFRILARLKGLRGTAFDVFGYTQERKTERRLIADYRSTIDALLPKLSEGNRSIAASIARLPNDIRGFGPVKEASIEKADAELENMLRHFEGAGRATQKSDTLSEPAE